MHFLFTKFDKRYNFYLQYTFLSFLFHSNTMRKILFYIIYTEKNSKILILDFKVKFDESVILFLFFTNMVTTIFEILCIHKNRINIFEVFIAKKAST